MTTPTNHWKLGLFVVVASACALGFLVFLGTQSYRKETVEYVSYFDEPVTGLEIGSSVSFRGVRVGNVSEIEIAPDRRHVEVAYALQVDVLSHMGLAKKHRGHVELKMPDDVRVQISANSITGQKHIKLDFLPNSPIPKLPFPVPENYIASSPSTLKNLEDAVMSALDRLPVLVEQASSVLSHAEGVMADAHAAGLPEKASILLSHATQTVDLLQTKLAGLDTVGISRQAHQAMLELKETLAQADKLMAQLNSDKGLLVSVQRASDAMGDVAANARGTGPKLERTLEHVSEVAMSMQRLLDALERDPDMLLKGRARSQR